MVKKAIRYLRVDPWLIEEEGFHSLRGCVSESVFSLANEFMGVRGYFEEGYSGESIAGSYFNGIFERFFIDHPVRHRGMADEEQKMLNSVDWLYLRLELDGEVLDLAKSKFSDFKRTLDMRTGLLRRSFVWKTPKGKKLGLRFERFISMAEPNLACQRITFEPLNFSGSVKVLTGLDFTLVHHNTSGFISEPIESLWQQEKSGRAGGVSAISAKVPNSGHRIFSSYRLLCGQKIKEQKITEEKFVGSKFSLKLTKGESLEISRYYADRGDYGQQSGEFGFWKVMGPDEFQMDVNNNAYTNTMAKKIFEYTLDVVGEMRRKVPDKLAKVFKKTGVEKAELVQWKKMARLMKVNFDSETELIEQHDGFFDQPHIDSRKIPLSQIPIYDHWAYLKIFRYDMLKQPDVLLLLLFFSHDYSRRCKRVNYEYYEPRCSHESSLSPAIHSIFAAELGKGNEAQRFFEHATRLDLDDYNRNACIGLHVTSMAAAWMNIVQGFGGLRTDGKHLSFNPSLPKKWKAFSFKLIYRDSVLWVRVERSRVCFRTLRGKPVKVEVFGKIYNVKGKDVEISMPV